MPTFFEIRTANNYGYDELGNLKKDSAEGIQHIEWTVYGKVKSITRYDGFNKEVNEVTIYPSDLEFLYDPMGNRIAKIEKTRDANGLKDETEWKTTYYTRDAQGNEMACYKYCFVEEEASFKLIEHPMYGSSRVGTDNTEIELIDAPPAGSTFSHVLGSKQYELTNHLGNVLSTVSDRKIQHDDNTDGTVDYYTADITSAQDYFAFGMLEPARSFSSNKYKFGMNGQEKDDEIANVAGANTTAMFWEYDSRSGRRWNMDPVVKPCESPYATFANNPILYSDPHGDEVVNGDRIIADNAKQKRDNSNKVLSDYKSKNGISDNTKRKDFLESGGSKETWKEYKSLRSDAKKASNEFNRLNARANMTQKIIDSWAKNTPNLFNEVDKQTTDFVLFSENSEDMLNEGIGGGVVPAYTGTDQSPTLISQKGGMENALTVRIADNVKITSKDATGQFNLNHEAGHFLYIIKYTSDYIKFYNELNANGISFQGGHSKNDESGKVATKLGGMKDISNPAPSINVTGN